MRFFTVVFAMLALLLCSTGCYATDLPQQRPADFAVEFSAGGGMVDMWETLNVDQSGARYTIRERGNETTAQLALDAAALDTLWSVFRDNAFDQIGMHDRAGVIYDMPSTSVTLTSNGQQWRIAPSASDTVRDRDVARWQAVLVALRGLGEQAIAASSVAIRLQIDETGVGHYVSVQVGNVVMFGEVMTAPVDRSLLLLPGPHDVVVGIGTTPYDARYRSLTMELGAASQLSVTFGDGVTLVNGQ
jgi:hypothetical protein